jgi:hypothetical protein
MASTSSTDCADPCLFAFADGRRCTMLAAPGSKYGLCYFHHQQFIERLNKQHAGEQICSALDSDINTACDLSAAFTKLFRATALGYIKPKTAHTLTYLGNLMLQTHVLAKQEYESGFEDPWSDVVADSICFDEDQQPDAAPGKPVYPPDPDLGSSNSPQSSTATDDDRDLAQASASDARTAAATAASHTDVLRALKQNLTKMRQILEHTPPNETSQESAEADLHVDDPENDGEPNESGEQEDESAVSKTVPQPQLPRRNIPVSKNHSGPTRQPHPPKPPRCSPPNSNTSSASTTPTKTNALAPKPRRICTSKNIAPPRRFNSQGRRIFITTGLLLRVNPSPFPPCFSASSVVNSSPSLTSPDHLEPLLPFQIAVSLLSTKKGYCVTQIT